MSRIIIDPEVRHGKPVIKGTRVSVDVSALMQLFSQYILERLKHLVNFDK